MWYTKTGKDGDVVLSSRVRLARNIKGIPFGSRMSDSQQTEVIERCSKALNSLKFIDLDKMSDIEKKSLIEQHLISADMLKNDRRKALLLNEDSSLSVMLGEEDHIRIQSMAAGFDLDKCLENANKIDDELESKVEYGFSEKFGYLTCCPTNVGTGMRASVMMQLTALVMSRKIESIISVLSKLGIAVRGIYGEGSKALGNIFQISNQVTLGVSEEETIQKLKQIVSELAEKEREAADMLYKENKFRFEDKIMRSLGILKNAVILTSEETMSLLSDVRLGINTGIIKNISLEDVNKTMYQVLPATIVKNYNLMAAEERDLKRAELVKEYLK